MDELRTRNYLSIKWTLRQNSKERVIGIIQFERWTCKRLKQLNPYEARVWRASQVRDGLGVVYIGISGRVGSSRKTSPPKREREQVNG